MILNSSTTLNYLVKETLKDTALISTSLFNKAAHSIAFEVTPKGVCRTFCPIFLICENSICFEVALIHECPTFSHLISEYPFEIICIQLFQSLSL